MILSSFPCDIKCEQQSDLKTENDLKECNHFCSSMVTKYRRKGSGGRAVARLLVNLFKVLGDPYCFIPLGILCLFGVCVYLQYVTSVGQDNNQSETLSNVVAFDNSRA